MLTRKILCISALSLLASCSRTPKSESPSSSQPALNLKVRSLPNKAMIAMNDPAVADYIVNDVSDSLEAGAWRWGYERPEFRFQLKQTASQKLEVHFAVADATFKTTGPVTVKFLVNKKAVGSMRVTKPGDQVFSKTVPANLLKTDDFTDLIIEARPFWTSKTDGRRLSVILTKAGFLTEARG